MRLTRKKINPFTFIYLNIRTHFSPPSTHTLTNAGLLLPLSILIFFNARKKSQPLFSANILSWENPLVIHHYHHHHSSYARWPTYVRYSCCQYLNAITLCNSVCLFCTCYQLLKASGSSTLDDGLKNPRKKTARFLSRKNAYFILSRKNPFAAWVLHL